MRLRYFTALCAALALALTAPPVSSDDSDIFLQDVVEPNVVILLDSSGSMDETIDGQRKIIIARNVITNLLANVERYAYPEGTGGVAIIKARFDADRERFRLKVADHGVGMSKEQAGRAFDAFYTTGRWQGGTGIGLAVVHNIVHIQLDGKVSLETAPGVGACFTIDVPAVVTEKSEDVHWVRAR